MIDVHEKSWHDFAPLVLFRKTEELTMSDGFSVLVDDVIATVERSLVSRMRLPQDVEFAFEEDVRNTPGIVPSKTIMLCDITLAALQVKPSREGFPLVLERWVRTLFFDQAGDLIADYDPPPLETGVVSPRSITGRSVGDEIIFKHLEGEVHGLVIVRGENSGGIQSIELFYDRVGNYSRSLFQVIFGEHKMPRAETANPAE
jgi:hypothetical protein